MFRGPMQKKMHNRLIGISWLLAGMLLAACGKSAPAPTPEQLQQMEMMRQVTQQSIEGLIKRPLTPQEQACIVVKLDHGRLIGHVEPPLSNLLSAATSQVSTQPQDASPSTRP